MPKRQLRVNRTQLEDVFEAGSYMIAYYLDLETGAVVLVTEEARLFSEELPDTAKTAAQILAAAQQMPAIPDAQYEDVIMAALVERDTEESRYLLIPEQRSYEGYRDMEAFASTVEDPELAGKLEAAIDGKGAFRQFKDTLYDYPEERERWFEFQRARKSERMVAWLEDEEIDPVFM